MSRAHTMVRRRVGVGTSALADARAAGRLAASEAVGADADAKLVVVFCSSVYDPVALTQGVASVAGEAAVIGCTTAGEIATGGPGDSGVVVVAFGGEGFSVQTAVATNIESRLREAGAEVAAAAFAGLPGEGHRALLVLSDGLVGDQQEIVRGAHSILGAATPLVGACAADGMRMVATHQLHGADAHRGAVVAAAIVSDAPLGIGVRHGWRKVGAPLLVTESREGRVETIDGRPALDVYLERLEAPAEAWTDPSAFVEFARRHPLGLDRRASEDQVRLVAAADPEARALVCIADVPQGGVAWLMEGGRESVLDAADAACDAAVDALGGADPLAVLAFDCVARRSVLGEDGIAEEVERITRHARGAPVAGFYGYGEFARTRGLAGFHNQTLVVLAVG